MFPGFGMEGICGSCFLTFLWLAVPVVMIVAGWFIAQKAGYEPWWGILIIVPLLNVVLILYFAFIEWPIEQELREMREKSSKEPPPSIH